MSETRANPYGALVASALVTPGAGAGAFSGQVLGFSAVALALSVYTLTLSDAIDATDACILVTPFQASGVAITAASFGGAGVVQPSDTSIQVSTFSVAGAPANRSFYIEVFRKGVGA